MFDCARDDMRATAGVVAQRICDDAIDNEIVRLSCTAREDELPRSAAENPSNGPARPIYSSSRVPAILVDAAWIASKRGEVGQHGFQHALVNRRCRGVI
jgi:F420-dependent methylenetetrahydromethanopterin dehydrogenase